MSRMMRFATDEDFEAFLKRSTARPRSEPTVAARPHPRPVMATSPKEPVASRREAVEHAGAPHQKESELERRFAQQIRAAGLPDPEREYYHIAGRDFRLDFAWPALRLGVEIQGMAHRIKGKFNADIEKRALAMLAGWRVLELNGTAVREETGIEWLKALLR